MEHVTAYEEYRVDLIDGQRKSRFLNENKLSVQSFIS